MEPVRPARIILAIVYLAMVIGVARFSDLLVIRLVPAIGVILQTVLVFAVVKVVGDVLGLIVYPPREQIFGEDFLRELVIFVGVGAVAGVAIQLAVRLLGGPVPPGIPAAGGYLVYRWTTNDV